MEELREYFAIGVRLVWVLDPRARRALVHRSLTDVREFAEGQGLGGDDVLAGSRSTSPRRSRSEGL
jgi:hypothetical protein